ncbi:MAG: carboxylesterase family protein [Candidatus Solibacter usitatus]|nr:carboxylesterase family protein [Candidatus Solibacter usitatus]
MTLPTIFALLPLAAFAIQDPVATKSGPVSGAASEGVQTYKGIPFAAPPVGDLRWKAPQPVAAWKQVRQATAFGAPCVQTPYAAGSLYASAMPPVSEDCLSLNVWTAAKSPAEKRPVMVWIHGGALTRGWGGTPTYDGGNFAKKGVVLVTVNYRLGVFGFFAHPELTAESPHRASGNQGLLDQVAALRWVHENISAFGGDPGNVTIFGESAGSWSVNYLMATPLAKGLIHRVIGESGAAFSVMRSLTDGEKAGEKLGTLKDLRAKSADEIQKASSAAVTVVDGWMLREPVHAIFAAGKQNDVPLIAGFNADEATAFLTTLGPAVPAEAFERQIKERFGDSAEAFKKAYPASTPQENRQVLLDSWRDQVFGWQMRTWARQQTKTGKSPVYHYFFSRVPPGPSSARFGAYHAAEIAYVFGNLAASRPWQNADRTLSEAMQNYWINFAKTGDPNGKGLAAWPKFALDAEVSIEFGDAIRTRADVQKSGLDFFETQSRRGAR